ncbi:hypothetical protein ACAW74_15635 [Fibrella sp. WM1]|uniref:hypothetical protein n=1 Tax=Fibrella musci TaxID=3242485 RepID=UPI003522404F
MKKLLLVFFALISFTACKKDKEITPKPTALADKFVGTYKLNSFRFIDTQSQINLDLPTLPLTKDGQTISGTVALVKKTDTTVDMNFKLKSSDTEDFAFDIADLEVRQVGSEYGLFVDGLRVADVEGSVVIFNFSETDPTTKARYEMAYVAKR